MRQFSIIIPTIRKEELLHVTLEYALQAVEGSNAEIILVNDNKKEKPSLPASFSPVIVLENPSQGAAAARNHGASHAKGDILLFLDDDILISREHLEHARKLIEQYPGACFNFNWKYPQDVLAESQKTQFGRFLIHVGMIDYKGWVPDLPWSDKIFDVPKLAAFFLVVPSEIFNRSGGFNPAFKKQSVEDDEFSSRLHQLGIRMFIDPSVSVLHNERDKMELKKRLERLKTGAYNKRQAQEMGLKGYDHHYSFFRKCFYSIASAFMGSILFCTKLIPNLRLFDPFYRRNVHILIGTVIFQGYYRKDNSGVK